MTTQYLVQIHQRDPRTMNRRLLTEVALSAPEEASTPILVALATRQATKAGVPVRGRTEKTILALRAVDPTTGVHAWRTVAAGV